jgi:hypothetical protein
MADVRRFAAGEKDETVGQVLRIASILGLLDHRAPALVAAVQRLERAEERLRRDVPGGWESVPGPRSSHLGGVVPWGWMP